jgi:mannose-6-phosphate isomerase-like protein (cupin superfamily)
MGFFIAEHDQEQTINPLHRFLKQSKIENMITRNYKAEEVKENPHKVDVRQLYNDPSAQIMHITLKPGESLKPHKTPVNVVFYILEGTPVVHIGDESEVIEKDTLVESPADIVHFISNESRNIVRVLVVKAPRPEKITKLL